jgi:hypothetical protein
MRTAPGEEGQLKFQTEKLELPIERVALHAVVRLPSGALGAVLLRLRARRETVVHMEGGMTVRLSRGTLVRVVVTPEDLALVYVRRQPCARS